MSKQTSRPSSWKALWLSTHSHSTEIHLRYLHFCSDSPNSNLIAASKQQCRHQSCMGLYTLTNAHSTGKSSWRWKPTIAEKMYIQNRLSAFWCMRRACNISHIYQLYLQSPWPHTFFGILDMNEDTACDIWYMENYWAVSDLQAHYNSAINHTWNLVPDSAFICSCKKVSVQH